MDNQLNKADTFALIYWIDSKTKSVISTKNILRRNCTEGMTTAIPWKEITGVVNYYNGKILKISCDQASLNLISVNLQTGEIIDQNTPAFTKEVMDARSKLIKEKRNNSQSKKNAVKIIDEKLLRGRKVIITPNNPQATITQPAKRAPASTKGNCTQPRKQSVTSTQNNSTQVQSKNVPQGKKRSATSTEENCSRKKIVKLSSVHHQQDQARKLSPIPQKMNSSVSNDIDKNTQNEIVEDHEIIGCKKMKPRESVVISDDESDNEDEETYENGFIASEVSLELIQFVERLLDFLVYTYTKKTKRIREDLSMHLREAFKDAPGKVEIAENSGVYLNSKRLNAMELRFDHYGKWKKLSTELLVEFYDKYLKFMSAKGTRGTIGVHPKIYKAIYDLITKKAGNVPKKLYTKHVNKVCSNRKQKKKIQMENQKEKEKENVLKDISNQSSSTKIQVPRSRENSDLSSVEEYEFPSNIDENTTPAIDENIVPATPYPEDAFVEDEFVEDTYTLREL